MSPERDWKARTSLKENDSLRKKVFQKGTFFPLRIHFLVFNFLALLYNKYRGCQNIKVIVAAASALIFTHRRAVVIMDRVPFRTMV